MTELTCEQCGELAAELAVGVLSDCERTCVLAHLDGCSGCRNIASALTTIANQIIELLPETQPPHRVRTAGDNHQVAPLPQRRGERGFARARRASQHISPGHLRSLLGGFVSMVVSQNPDTGGARSLRRMSSRPTLMSTLVPTVVWCLVR